MQALTASAGGIDSPAAFPEPHVIGLPEQYTSWRSNQAAAVEHLLDTDKRVSALVCPTGFGKSLVYMALAELTGGRTVILTATKALQGQLLADFPYAVDIRGRNSYRCRAIIDKWVSCEDGPCTAGLHCRLKASGDCEYYAAVQRAKAAKVVVTNYAYWMAQNRYSKGLGRFDLIVCDEAHSAPDLVSAFLEVRLSKRNRYLASILPQSAIGMLLEDWVSWANSVIQRVEADLIRYKGLVADTESREAIRDYKAVKASEAAVSAIATMHGGWVVDNADGGRHRPIRFAPVWPKGHTERVLFLGVPRVLLVSASIRPKTTELLGIAPADLDFKEYPHGFPERNRRITHIPTIRMNYQTDQYGMRKWLSTIDNIVRGRLDRKGVLHTVSYGRRDFFLANTRHRDIVITHSSRDTEARVAEFKRADPPALLVSPSVTTGYDFPYEQCRYQIIGKLPYPDMRDPISKARMEQDSSYPSYLAMQTLIQAVGRGVRAADDWCECFVVDDNIQWFLPRNRGFAPGWFLRAFRSAKVIPKAPERG